MTGAILALAGAGASGGGSGTPGSGDWGNLYGQSGAATNFVTLTGVTGSIAVSATNSGPSTLGYTLGDVNATYAGPFAWPEGVELGWYVIGAGSGTIAVTYGGGTALGSFTYTITNPRPDISDE